MIVLAADDAKSTPPVIVKSLPGARAKPCVMNRLATVTGPPSALSTGGRLKLSVAVPLAVALLLRVICVAESIDLIVELTPVPLTAAPRIRFLVLDRPVMIGLPLT